MQETELGGDGDRDDSAAQYIPEYVYLDPDVWWRTTNSCTVGVISHYRKPETVALALPLHVYPRPPAAYTYLGRPELP
jgi:hypothetical protein